MGILGDDGAAFAGHLRGAVARLAGEPADKIKKMRPENEEVFAAGAVVHHAEDFHLDEVTDEFLPLLMEELDVRVAAHLVDNGDFEILPGGKSEKFVGLLQGSAERPLAADVSTGFEGGLYHVVVLVRPAGRDGDDIGLFPLEHFAIIGVGTFGSAPGMGFLERLGIPIDNGDKTNAVETTKNEVEAVAEVPPAGVTDDGGTVSLEDGKGNFLRSGMAFLRARFRLSNTDDEV